MSSAGGGFQVVSGSHASPETPCFLTQHEQEALKKYLTTTVGRRVWSLERRAETGWSSRVFLCSYVPGWRCVALAEAMFRFL